MRVIPILTALLVTFALYLAVFERDSMLAFARGDDRPVAEEESTAEAGPAAKATPRVGVVVLRSSAQEIDNAVILRGETKASRQVEVRAETSATVISEPLRKGAQVAQGDLLCELDPGTREATLTEARARLTEARSHRPEAEARLEEARALLEEAEINYNAAEKLSAEGYASETRLKSARAGVRSAEAGIASAEAGVESSESGIEAATAAVAAAEKEITRLKITAPFAGLLESDSAELGSLMQPGSLCATVIQLNPIKLVGYVPETEISRVKLGAQAGAELVDGHRVAGEVTFVSRSADPTTRTFLAEVTVPNPDLSISDGQTATIAISSKGAQAHKLPQSALTLNNDGQLGVRIVDADNVVQFVPVRMLRDESSGVWVSGLAAEADVIVVGQDFVTQGVQVAPTYREAGK
ncbi:efflux RND transporter periplasmic adaptor subunit [Arenibacterium halophilum]|uniref:Efflux RND transporter periplasmic adaptor subunit n=1 Tax=Arenibacterium halophilum TaxID=2583821 RepID=A0ABY2XBP1_9RHOB|nr:efflux RND transporter periplasmic adaptor subunit [Arenibacterium halophilum]TMV13265.1 efflux RND transporter periplasmic adaptor subunit [Arenibacterium halophilum]